MSDGGRCGGCHVWGYIGCGGDSGGGGVVHVIEVGAPRPGRIIQEGLGCRGGVVEVLVMVVEGGAVCIAISVVVVAAPVVVLLKPAPTATSPATATTVR